jgi:site-specific DNA recombinase
VEQMNNPSSPHYIKFVANYLRKSRGESEDDLKKHKLVLTELCEKNEWKYIEYAEIESGDSIAMRPIFQKLLFDIEQGLYDCVCVVDIDRLGRGNIQDRGQINSVFLNSDTLIATPDKIYNLSNENDDFLVEVKGLLARQEYKQIVKRLSQGKKVGARLGNWTNGTPPYPYVYERWFDNKTSKEKYNEKGLVVDDDKLEIYRYIIDSIVEDSKTPNEIAWELNKKKIPSPRNGIWHGLTVYRLAIDETHLGKIITNKTIGDGHKNKKPNAKPQTRIPKSEWTVIENCHEIVKTLYEHEQIQLFLHRKTKTPSRTLKKILPLTSLIKCGICGHTMMLLNREDRRTPEIIKPCWFKDELGNKCGNRGAITTYIYDFLNVKIDEQEDNLLRQIEKGGDNDNSKKQIEIEMLLKEINKKEEIIQRIDEAFEEGIYDKNKYKERMSKVKQDIDELESQLNILEIELKRLNTSSPQERLLLLNKAKEIIHNRDATGEQINSAYKSIIREIVWLRQKDDIEIAVNFI